MANTVTASPILRPEDVDALLIVPALAASVAGEVSRVVRTSSQTFRVPRVTADPSASWVGEGAEIPLSNPTLDEVDVTPSKVAGLTVITNELAGTPRPRLPSGRCGSPATSRVGWTRRTSARSPRRPRRGSCRWPA
jgi:hypothetical protein